MSEPLANHSPEKRGGAPPVRPLERAKVPTPHAFPRYENEPNTIEAVQFEQIYEEEFKMANELIDQTKSIFARSKDENDVDYDLRVIGEVEQRLKYRGDYEDTDDAVNTLIRSKNIGPEMPFVLMGVEVARAKLLKVENDRAIKHAQTVLEENFRRDTRVEVGHAGNISNIQGAYEHVLDESKAWKEQPRRDILAFTLLADRLLDVVDPSQKTGESKTYRQKLQTFDDIVRDPAPSQQDKNAAANALVEVKQQFYERAINVMTNLQNEAYFNPRAQAAEKQADNHMKTILERSLALPLDQLISQYEGVTTSLSQRSQDEMRQRLAHVDKAALLDYATKGADLMKRRTSFNPKLYDIPPVHYKKFVEGPGTTPRPKPIPTPEPITPEPVVPLPQPIPKPEPGPITPEPKPVRPPRERKHKLQLYTGQEKKADILNFGITDKNGFTQEFAVPFKLPIGEQNKMLAFANDPQNPQRIIPLPDVNQNEAQNAYALKQRESSLTFRKGNTVFTVPHENLSENPFIFAISQDVALEVRGFDPSTREIILHKIPGSKELWEAQEERFKASVSPAPPRPTTPRVEQPSGSTETREAENIILSEPPAGVPAPHVEQPPMAPVQNVLARIDAAQQKVKRDIATREAEISVQEAGADAGVAVTGQIEDDVAKIDSGKAPVDVATPPVPPSPHTSTIPPESDIFKTLNEQRETIMAAPLPSPPGWMIQSPSTAGEATTPHTALATNNIDAGAITEQLEPPIGEISTPTPSRAETVISDLNAQFTPMAGEPLPEAPAWMTRQSTSHQREVSTTQPEPAVSAQVEDALENNVPAVQTTENPSVFLDNITLRLQSTDVAIRAQAELQLKNLVANMFKRSEISASIVDALANSMTKNTEGVDLEEKIKYELAKERIAHELLYAAQDPKTRIELSYLVNSNEKLRSACLELLQRDVALPTNESLVNNPRISAETTRMRIVDLYRELASTEETNYPLKEDQALLDALNSLISLPAVEEHEGEPERQKTREFARESLVLLGVIKPDERNVKESTEEPKVSTQADTTRSRETTRRFPWRRTVAKIILATTASAVLNQPNPFATDTTYEPPSAVGGITDYLDKDALASGSVLNEQLRIARPESSAKIPALRLRDAPLITLKGAPVKPENSEWTESDSNSPAFRDGDTLYVFNSHGNIVRSSGPNLENLNNHEPVTFVDKDFDGKVWLESVYKQDDSLYGWYHFEKKFNLPGSDENRKISTPSIGLAYSMDNGLTWHDKGTLIESPDTTFKKYTENAFFSGGVGDFSVIADRQKDYVYISMTSYDKDPSQQGIAIARIRTSQLQDPAGKLELWDGKAWEPYDQASKFTPIFPSKQDMHEKDADFFWGPTVHYNTEFNLYVMFLNHAGNAEWEQDGIYVSYNPDPSNPNSWSKPGRFIDAQHSGDWYPQVISENGDTEVGKEARFFTKGLSNKGESTMVMESLFQNVTPHADVTESETVTPVPEKTKTEQPGILKDNLSPILLKEAQRVRDQRDREDPEWKNRVDRELNKDRVNILLYGYGTYLRPGHAPGTFGANQVLSINTRTNTADTISITSDTRNPTAERYLASKGENVGVLKINNAFESGKKASGEAVGFETMRRSFEEATGLSMDFQVVATDEVLKNLVDDVLGGLEIDIPHDFSAYKITADGKEYPDRDFTAGRHRLNGVEVLQYVKGHDWNQWQKGQLPHHRKDTAVASVIKAAKGKMNNFVSSGLFAARSAAFAKRAIDNGSIKLDINPTLFLKDPSLISKILGQGFEVENKIVMMDPDFGGEGIWYVGKDANINPASAQDLADNTYGEHAWTVEVPINGNPYAPDLVTGYWGSTRKLVKGRLSS